MKAKVFADDVSLVVEPIGIEESSPLLTTLIEINPNPVHSTANIVYTLPIATNVDIKLYDVSGRVVKILERAKKYPGTHTIKWDSRGISSGIYFVKIASPEFSATQKITLIR